MRNFASREKAPPPDCPIMLNVAIFYLYRDRHNCKSDGQIIFTNPDGLEPLAIKQILADAFDQNEYFIPPQIRIPPVYPFTSTSEYDHHLDNCWHELFDVTFTEEAPTDPRSISGFLREVEREAASGWREFSCLLEIGIDLAECQRLVTLGPDHPDYINAVAYATLQR